jgi:hypothetical protein
MGGGKDRDNGQRDLMQQNISGPFSKPDIHKMSGALYITCTITKETNTFTKIK